MSSDKDREEELLMRERIREREERRDRERQREKREHEERMRRVQEHEEWLKEARLVRGQEEWQNL